MHTKPTASASAAWALLWYGFLSVLRGTADILDYLLYSFAAVPELWILKCLTLRNRPRMTEAGWSVIRRILEPGRKEGLKAAFVGPFGLAGK